MQPNYQPMPNQASQNEMASVAAQYTKPPMNPAFMPPPMSAFQRPPQSNQPPQTNPALVRPPADLSQQVSNLSLNQPASTASPNFYQQQPSMPRPPMGQLPNGHPQPPASFNRPPPPGSQQTLHNFAPQPPNNYNRPPSLPSSQQQTPALSSQPSPSPINFSSQPPSMPQPHPMAQPQHMTQPPSMSHPSMSQPPLMSQPPSMSHPPMSQPPLMSQPPSMSHPPMSQPPSMSHPPMSQPPSMSQPPLMTQPPPMGYNQAFNQPPSNSLPQQGMGPNYASQAGQAGAFGAHNAATGGYPNQGGMYGANNAATGGYQPQGVYNQGGMGPYGGAMRPPVPGQTPQPMYEQQQAQQKMDMDQIPNPIEVMQANESKFGGQFFETNESGKMPPLTTTNFTCKDMGNCNPRFIRSSMYSVPNNADLLKQSKLPLVLSLTPFAELAEGESEPPVSDMGEMGPIRCKRCKAYMCPFMQFVDNGKKFQCPFCEDITQVSQEYFNHLDHMGKRVDTYERAELCCGSYEFTATKDYCRNQSLPQSPAIIFMIDVSVNSIRSGLLHVLCPYIKDVLLPNLPRDSLNPAADQSDLKVGFVTYDKELHFYNLKSSLAAPQMMIVSDIDEVFVPILDGFLVRLSESRTVIENLLDSLPSMFQENKETEIVLGPVVEAGIDALKSANLAGKLFIFHTNLPNCVAPGQLKMRDDKKLLATDKEKLLLSPQNDYYAQLGKKCVENGCTIDLFVMPNQYCDLATLSDLTRKTSGQIYKYDFFMADTHGQRLCEDLKYAVDKTVAFDAVMKVRTSTGIRPVDYIGNFGMYGNDIELAGVNKQTSLAVELKHDDKLNENAKVYIQAALLYTSLSGQRRIRVHNLSLNVCTQYSQVYSTCELDCMVNYMAKLACRSITVSSPKSIRENLVNQVSHILATYRKNCTNSPAKGQFILPETLKLLPVFSNSLLKSDAISGSQTVTTDERAYLMYRLMSMDIKSTYYYFYPRVLQVHDLESEEEVPSPIRCIYERLKDDGIYLLENGLCMYLWIGANVQSNLIQNLFGVSAIQQLNVEKAKILEIDTQISVNLRSLINKINQERKSSLKLTVARKGDSLEYFFKNLLVEDKGTSPNSMSYVEYLYHLHREIKNILS